MSGNDELAYFNDLIGADAESTHVVVPRDLAERIAAKLAAPEPAITGSPETQAALAEMRSGDLLTVEGDTNVIADNTLAEQPSPSYAPVPALPGSLGSLARQHVPGEKE